MLMLRLICDLWYPCLVNKPLDDVTDLQTLALELYPISDLVSITVRYSEATYCATLVFGYISDLCQV